MAVGGLAVTEGSRTLCKVNISDGTALKHEGGTNYHHVLQRGLHCPIQY